jgi:hypothetical protein
MVIIILGRVLRTGLSVPIFLFVPHKKDFHYNPSRVNAGALYIPLGLAKLLGWLFVRGCGRDARK